MAMLEKCANKFCGLDTEHLKKALYRLVANDPRNYGAVGEFLTEFANRGEYEFVYEFLSETPIDLGYKECKLLGDMIEDIPYALISSYGAFIKAQYEARHLRKRRFVCIDEYSHRLGIEKVKFEKISFPAPGSAILFMPKAARL